MRIALPAGGRRGGGCEPGHGAAVRRSQQSSSSSDAESDGRFLTDLLPGLLVLGFGMGLVFVSVSVTAMSGIPAQHAGMASGFLMTGHEVGAALGVAVLSAAAATAGRLTTAAGAADAFGRGLIAAAGLAAVVAVVAATTMPRTRQQAGAAVRMHH